MLSDLSLQFPYLKVTRADSFKQYFELINIVEIIRRFCKEKQLDPNMCSILDVGCGPGNIALPLAYLGYNLTGIDVDREQIFLANMRKSVSHLKVNFILSNGLDYLKTHQEQFNIIICSHVLDHMNVPEILCKYAYKNIHDKGIIVICVPNTFASVELFYFKPKSLVNNIIRRKSKYHREHVQCFTLGRLERMLTTIGFKFELISSIGSILCLHRIPFIGKSLELIELRLRKPNFMAWSWIVIGKKDTFSAKQKD